MQESHERPTSVRYGVLAAFCAAASIAYLQRTGLGMAKSQVTESLGISDQTMGFVMGSFFVTYALAQIPGARLARLRGTRFALTLFAVLWSMSTAALALAPNWWLLLIAQLAMGASQAGLFPAATISLTYWIPATRRGMATGALASFMSVGGACGTALGGLILKHFSWPVMFLLYSLPGIVWAAWFHYWFRNRPDEHRAVNEAELALIRRGQPDAPAHPIAHHTTPWGSLLSSRAMWCINGQHVFRAAGYIFYITWYPTYLQEARGVSLVGSGFLTSLPLIAVVAGSPLGGITSDWILNRTGSRFLGRQLFAAACMTLTALLILSARQVANPLLAAYTIAAGSFCAAFGGPCAYAITMDMGGRHVAAVFSTMNAVGSAGAFAFAFVVPWIRDCSGWDGVLYTFAGIYVAAAICWLAFDARGTIAPEPSADHGLPKAV